MKLCRYAMAAVCFLSWFSVCAYGQDEPFTKETIIQMVKAGLPEDVIVSRIRSEANPPKISNDDLLSLKAAGAGDEVIRALVTPSPEAAPLPSGRPANIQQADPDDPMGPHDPGIYMMVTTREGKKKLVLIERAGSGREKTANVWGHAFSYGIAKAKIKAQLPGPRAAVRSSEERPEFYMYFPPTGNLGAADTISGPSQFALLRLEGKKDHRETTVLKVGFGSASAGNDENKTIMFTAEKIRPYVYRAAPDVSLKDGEYAFIAATGMIGSASGGSVVVFDFGVDLE